ncbi:MAG: chloride channel protein [Clostridia bacterium]|nr:chloride channel protein [Clostridia bacterium]
MFKEKISSYCKFIFSFLFLPALAGALCGGVVFLFKVAAGFVIEKSHFIYAMAKTSAVSMVIFFATVVLLSVLSAFILNKVPDARGGGIPSAVTILRGLVRFNWWKSLVFTFFSSLITFFSGIPLGNEGPSVQMGAAIGKMTVRMFGEKHKALDRYVMTGGASAGFAVATGAPVAGVFFALEEAHRRFTPTILITATVSVLAGFFTANLLSIVTGITTASLVFPAPVEITLSQAWIAPVAGIASGLLSIGVYAIFSVGRRLRKNIEKINYYLKYLFIFLLTAVLGLFIPYVTGTGHGIIESLFESDVTWYMLALVLVIRCILASSANNLGITGGLFVPLIAFGAVGGALTAKLLISLGAIDSSMFATVVIMSVAAFLGASLKTPITAIIFVTEISGSVTNLGYTLLAVLTAYMLLEFFNVPSTNDVVIESKIAKVNAGKKKTSGEASLTVMKGSHVIGREPRDILWPNSCFVLGVNENQKSKHGVYFAEGDVIHFRFDTFDIERIRRELIELLGKQELPDELFSEEEFEAMNVK